MNLSACLPEPTARLIFKPWDQDPGPSRGEPLASAHSYLHCSFYASNHWRDNGIDGSNKPAWVIVPTTGLTEVRNTTAVSITQPLLNGSTMLPAPSMIHCPCEYMNIPVNQFNSTLRSNVGTVLYIGRND